MKKILTTLIVIFCASAQVAVAFPTDARYECTFSSIQFSEDGVAYGDNILSEPMTIDFFSSEIRTASGTTAAISVATGEAVRYIKMSVAGITLSASGETTRDVLEEIEEAGFEGRFDNVTMEVLPFVYSGGEIQLNMFVPKPGAEVDFETWNAQDNGPTFNFYGAGVSQDLVGTVNITVVNADDGDYLFAQVYRSREQGVGPVFTNPFATPAANSSAEGSIVLPAGTFFLAVSASNSPLSEESSSSFVDTEWTINSVNRSDSIITVEAGGTHSVTVSREATEGDQEEEDNGDPAGFVMLVTSESVIDMGEGAEILVFTSTTEAGLNDGATRDVPLMTSLEAGSFTSATLTVEVQSAGTYYCMVFLDINNNRLIDQNVDYLGAYGQMGNPDPITVNEDQLTDITEDPVVIELDQGGGG